MQSLTSKLPSRSRFTAKIGGRQTSRHSAGMISMAKVPRPKRGEIWQIWFDPSVGAVDRWWSRTKPSSEVRNSVRHHQPSLAPS